MNETSLIVLTKAAQMLERAGTIQEVQELKGKFLVAAEWAKQMKLGKASEEKARMYALRAERKMGEMLTAAAKAGELATRQRNPGTLSGKTPSGVPDRNTRTTKTADLGITRKERSQAEKLAAVPEKKFEAVVAGSKTVLQAKRELREDAREDRRQENAKKAASVSSPVAAEARFATILIDPPWDWGDEGDVNQMGRAKPDYATMPLTDLARLPVARLSDVDCHLYCWVTNRSMPKVFGLMETWGFRFVTILTWPKPSFGMGNYFRGQTEHIVFGVRGSQMLKRKDASTLLPAWARGKGGHSSKPTEIYDFIESCSPGPYLEMFSRQNREGWTMWGAGA